jgi:translation initiation factor 4G
LNKLTVEKFEVLSDQLLDVGIDSVEILTAIIKLVFDKALTEPKFSKMYAELCRKLSEHCPDFKTADGKAHVSTHHC